ncbi:FadR/GntR family transcriptional regulator [Actinomadura livida]|uniref:DNA-binding FadR family transcriptional regulator n=1 Tax=Actinomadura livida TaxID=79909 RepID=A0A7W7MZQ2_9ACTN|nr:MULTISPECIES: FCD domain-containing protein [Actinomadura]MBB4776090.1 DNA-binding FadR family transcriptional regulator [Actinomadura catellatispora]GGU15562.1 GntR family transcriptional regulator [Actinomadura livida]
MALPEPGIRRGPSAPSDGVRPPKTGELVARRLRRRIVEGSLSEGDYLPTEAALMEHFGVSRPTLREAFRVLESEGLIELRRGSRTGARVTVPGPEAIARPAALLLQLGKADLADVYRARSAIEPPAARLLALSGDDERYAALEEELELARAAVSDYERFAVVSAHFHLRLVELSGNQTLALMAGMVHEIILRQTQVSVRAHEATGAHGDYPRALRAYAKLVTLVRAGDGPAAERFWHRHLQVADELVLRGREATSVIDVLE